ncbi:LysR family transcriptional regulator [Methylocella sp. CPCC 101449]|uniref:LysR family transcriptional regulator n=1 Tax=Methylocella sp. CPCC 101449 TaxID=2987531 RepID=UPI00288D35F8|nr:LysR family transcriptional regulator [Methylocella sp. CPCC 101449]MDT2020027.1 LysR family transcriptional regulator [Methylocella sp. CPCC 101449]
MTASPQSIAIERFFRLGLRLNHLRLLVSLARLGQVKKVAAALNVTQPAVSKQIAEMEAALQMPLVMRNGRQLAFTEAGEILVKRGMEILLQIEHGRAELDGLVTGAAGRVAIGAVPTVTHSLPKAIALFQAQTPDVTLTLVEGTTDKLFPLLADGTFDLVISRTPPALDTSMFREMLLGSDPYVVVCGRQHPLAQRQRVRWRDLAGFKWVLPPAFSAIHGTLMDMLSAHGIALPPGCMIWSAMHALPEFLPRTQTLALMPGSIARNPIYGGTLTVLPLELPGPGATVRAVSRQADPPEATALMLNCLKQAFAG